MFVDIGLLDCNAVQTCIHHYWNLKSLNDGSKHDRTETWGLLEQTSNLAPLYSDII
jgi:hypothetical protein